jgi:hypothetical protein
LLESIEAEAPELAMPRDPIEGRTHAPGLKVQFVLATLNATRDQAGSLEDGEVLCNLCWRLRQRLRERRDRLVAALSKPRKHSAPGRMTQRKEHFVELRLKFAR